MTLWEALFTACIGLTIVLLLANVLFGFNRSRVARRRSADGAGFE